MRGSEFVRTYFDQLPSLRRRIARFFANPEDVEDVLQETFVRTSQISDDEVTSFKGYVHRTARNIALSELNRKSRTVTSYIDDLCGENLESLEVPVDQQVSDRLQMEAFAHAIASLPTQCRRAFLLSKLYGLKQKEVASHKLVIHCSV